MSGGYLLKSGIAVALVTIALPVQAQTQPPSQRGYLVGFGGAASTEVTSPYFGGSFGMNVTRDLQVTFEISRAQDVYADFTKTDLGIAAQDAAAAGIPLTSTVKMPTNFYTGGIRYLLPVGGPARPYIAGTGGAAHMSPEPTFTLGGIDVTSVAMQETGVVKTAFREDTRPIASVAGGVVFTVARHLTFDLGYKFSAIFVNTDYLQDFETSPHSHSRIYLHRVLGGVGFTF